MILISEENVKSILDMIEDLVLNSAKIPILNKLIIDEDKLFGLLDELSKNLPQEMSESIEIVENKERILSEADNRAQEMVSSAEMRAKVLVSESEVLKKALLESNNLKHEINKQMDLAKNQVNMEISLAKTEANKEIDIAKSEANKDRELKGNEVNKYADSMLENLENQLTNAISVLRNGRNSLTQS